MADNDKALTVTYKAGTEYDAAWLVLKADDPIQMQSMVEAVASNGLGAVIASGDAAFKAAFTVGKGLGATPVAAPQNPAPPQQTQAQAQQDNPWAAQQPAQQVPPADSNPWGVPAQQAQPAGAANTFGGGGGEAGAPYLAGLGMHAKRVTGTSKKTGKPYAFWGDPRAYEITKHMPEKTDDPNHPGLTAGTHSFTKFDN